MADKNDGGEKTEMPTPKRLRDARKKGDVAKSKDVGAAFVTLAWVGMIALVAGYVATDIAALTVKTIDKALTLPFEAALGDIGMMTIDTMIRLTVVTLVPIAFLATFIEFVQVGPIATTEKLKFGLDKLNPVEGLKKMFGTDGLVELVKTLIKVLLVLIVVWVVLERAIKEATGLMTLSDWSPVAGNGAAVAEFSFITTYDLTIQLFTMVAVVFLFVAGLDYIHAKHSFIKKMKMSMRDIKKEHKDNEGDPYIKQSRRQMHEEWANSNAVGAAGSASALLVNPTHIAIAIDYDAETCPVPVMAARGEGPLAAAMRAEAEAKGVPIIRNVVTARRLWNRGEVGEIVPEDMFDAIAEVILWAKKARNGEAPMWTDLDTGKPAVVIAQEIAA